MFNVNLFSVNYDLVKTLTFSDFFDAVSFASRPEWVNATITIGPERVASYSHGQLVVWSNKYFKF